MIVNSWRHVSTSGPYISLRPTEVVPGRPFTNLAHTDQDITHLEYILSRLRQVLNQLSLERPQPYLFYLAEAAGRQHRLFLQNAPYLQGSCDLIAVGFCGQRRPVADRSPLETADAEISQELPQNPYLLSYNSLELADGNWCNLVLFSQAQGLAYWLRGAKHEQAARELSPQFYYSIRLHKAILPGGLFSGHPLTLQRTKYYDYKGKVTWGAIREF